jgi:RNA polymerase sigma factor (sigma-70 family)
MRTSTTSDHELVERVKQGLTPAFEELVRRYQGISMRLALSILENREDAEEAVQDSFVRAYKGISRFRQDSKFSTWLYRIVYNTSYTRLKKRRTFTDISAVEDRFDERLLQGTEDPGISYPSESIDLFDLVREGLHSLPQRYRTVLTLFYLEELKIDEIARIMMIGQSSIKVRLYRGRNLLRDIIAKKTGKEVPQ